MRLSLPGRSYAGARAVFLVVGITVASTARSHEGVHEQIERLSLELRRQSDRADLYLERGELHRLHGDWTKALADYRSARQLEPGLARVDLCLGKMYLEAGERGKAVAALDRFLAAEPGHITALVTRARALRLLGRHLEAVQDYTDAIEGFRGSRRPSPDYYLERARALRAAGKDHREEAIRGLDEGLRKLGTLVTLQLLAIELECEMGRHDSALERLGEIEKLAANKPFVWARRGEILLDAERPAEAREALEDARASIRSLPAHRRSTPALRNLADRIESRLEELGAGVASGEPRHTGGWPTTTAARKGPPSPRNPGTKPEAPQPGGDHGPER